MYRQCMRCDSKNLATLDGNKQVCVECGWHTDNMTMLEVARVILKYYDECEERQDGQKGFTW